MTIDLVPWKRMLPTVVLWSCFFIPVAMTLESGEKPVAQFMATLQKVVILKVIENWMNSLVKEYILPIEQSKRAGSEGRITNTQILAQEIS